MFGEHLSCY